MSITELLPSITTLSRADKFKLIQIILQQLAQEDYTKSRHNLLDTNETIEEVSNKAMSLREK